MLEDNLENGGKNNQVYIVNEEESEKDKKENLKKLDGVLKDTLESKRSLLKEVEVRSVIRSKYFFLYQIFLLSNQPSIKLGDLYKNI